MGDVWLWCVGYENCGGGRANVYLRMLDKPLIRKTSVPHLPLLPILP